MAIPGGGGAARAQCGRAAGRGRTLEAQRVAAARRACTSKLDQRNETKGGGVFLNGHCFLQ